MPDKETWNEIRDTWNVENRESLLHILQEDGTLLTKLADYPEEEPEKELENHSPYKISLNDTKKRALNYSIDTSPITIAEFLVGDLLYLAFSGGIKQPETEEDFDELGQAVIELYDLVVKNTIHWRHMAGLYENA